MLDKVIIIVNKTRNCTNVTGKNYQTTLLNLHYPCLVLPHLLSYRELVSFRVSVLVDLSGEQVTGTLFCHSDPYARHVKNDFITVHNWNTKQGKNLLIGDLFPPFIFSHIIC